MKKFLLFLLTGSFITTISAQQNIADAPVMTFDSLVYNFGTVEQGTIIQKEFHFTNTGKSPLIINNAVGSGVTIATYPKEPILPGKSGIVKVICPTDGRSGLQDRTNTITSNNRDGTIVLHMKGIVTTEAVLTFDSTTYHFPKTPQGQEVVLEIPFKNTGKEPLIVFDYVTACGCDVASGPRKPIPPGGTGIINYHLDTNSRMGKQSKVITITYSSNKVLVIHIEGEIIPASEPH